MRGDGTLLIPKEANMAWRLLLADGFGHDIGDSLIMDPVEAVYLVLKGRATVENCEGDRIDVARKIIDMVCKTDPNFMIRLSTYMDLRDRGYKVRVLKNSASGPIDFEVYEKGEDPLTGESNRLVMVVFAEKSIGIEKLDEALNMAREKDKTLVLAIVDQDGDIVYYKVDSALKFEVSLKLRKG